MNINYIGKIILAIAIVALSAQVTFDVGDIPITGQTLSILVLALLLSPIDIFSVIIGYLALGFIGLPIFADEESGIEKLWGGSGGFLIGFVIGSVSISYLYQFYKTKKIIPILLLTSLGTAIILVCGVGRLTMLYGFDKAIEYGFTPFWKGAILKILLGTVIVYLIQKQQISKTIK